MARHADPNGNFTFDCPLGWRVLDLAEQEAIARAMPRKDPAAGFPTQIVHDEHGCISISAWVVASHLGVEDVVPPLSWDEARTSRTSNGAVMSWSVTRGGTMLIVRYDRDHDTSPRGLADARAIVESIALTAGEDDLASLVPVLCSVPFARKHRFARTGFLDGVVVAYAHDLEDGLAFVLEEDVTEDVDETVDALDEVATSNLIGRGLDVYEDRAWVAIASTDGLAASRALVAQTFEVAAELLGGGEIVVVLPERDTLRVYRRADHASAREFARVTFERAVHPVTPTAFAWQGGELTPLPER